MDNYQKRANDFLSRTETSMTVEFLKNDYHFLGDKTKRDIYQVTFTRGERIMKLNFGRSYEFSRYNKYEMHLTNFMTGPNLRDHYKKLQEAIKPDAYDVLACLTKSDVGSFEDFCDNYGYDNDSIQAQKMHKNCVKEFSGVQNIWTDKEIEELQEIN